MVAALPAQTWRRECEAARIRGKAARAPAPASLEGTFRNRRRGRPAGLPLQRRLGADQVTGIVLHAGTEGWRIDDGVYAVPIARLWTPA